MDAPSLAEENARLRAELERLRARLAAVEQEDKGGSGGDGGGAHGGRGGDGGGAPASPPPPPPPPRPPPPKQPPLVRLKHALTTAQCERYARHLVLPAFGAAAQARLCARSVLVVGCGGLGAPAALYLAAAGVGRLGLADRDAVEASNLHRQVIHGEGSVGRHKALSAAGAVRALNSGVAVETHLEGLSARNAGGLVAAYDVILDCSDNAPTRYLLSDACAAAGRPLVSAAAVGTDGQLTVYCRGSVRGAAAKGAREERGEGGGGGDRTNDDDGTNDDDENDDDDDGEDDDTPCYRCLFPDPPAPETCSRCAEAGVLGPVPGVMGVLQALEALKLLGGVGRGAGGGGRGGGGEEGGGGAAAAAPAQPAVLGEPLVRRMLLYDAMSARFSTVKLRARRDGCVACGGRGRRAGDGGGEAGGGDGEGNGAAGSLRLPGAVAATDYAAFTGQSADDALPPSLALIPEGERVTAAQLAARMRGDMAEGAPGAGAAVAAPSASASAASAAAATADRGALVILDVRPRAQFDVMALSGAVNVPFSELDRRWQEVEALAAAGQGADAKGAAAADAGAAAADAAHGPTPPPPSVVVVCRRGNHSQLCARRLRAALVAKGVDEERAKVRVRDLVGGYEGWAASCEPHVPVL